MRALGDADRHVEGYCCWRAPSPVWCGVLMLTALPALLFSQPPHHQDMERYSQQASQAMSSKNWPEAASSLEKLARMAPNVAEVQGNLGLVYYAQNRVFDAAQAFERALKLNPKMDQARMMLGLCNSELGRNEEAIQLLAPAFARASDDATVRMIGLGLQRAYAAQADYDKASQVTSQLLKRFPKDPEILFQTSRLYAVRSYRLMKELIELPADSPWAHYANGEVYESMGQYDTAIAECRTVVKMAPQLPGIHFRIGKIMLQKSQAPQSLEEAQHEFEMELAVSPQNSEAEYELGEIYRHRSRFEQSVEHFSQAVRYHPEFEEAQIGLARSLINLGENQEALEHLLGAAQLDPENDIPHYLLASVYRSLGESAKSELEMGRFRKIRASRRGGATEDAKPGANSGVTRQTIDSELAPKP